MRVCLIAEKSSLAREVLPVIREMHPDMDPDAFAYALVNPCSHLNARFRYPRGLGWGEYPFAGRPDYEPVRFVPLRWTGLPGHPEGIVPAPGGDGTARDKQAADVRRGPRFLGVACPEAGRRFNEADAIYAAIDPGDSSYLALDHVLDSLSPGPGVDVIVPRIMDLCPMALRRAFAGAGRRDGEDYQRMVCRGRISRRFDYGYHVNALAIMGRTMAVAGAAPGTRVPSKFALQTLYVLRRGGPRTEGCLVDDMQRWRGTGRYGGAGLCGIGTTASQVPIIEHLKSSGLAAREGRTIGISPLGTRFLGLLHPDCEDPDLRHRIEAWKGLPEDDANARVDRYLRTFFGKQIRYLARATREAPGASVTVA